MDKGNKKPDDKVTFAIDFRTPRLEYTLRPRGQIDAPLVGIQDTTRNLTGILLHTKIVCFPKGFNMGFAFEDGGDTFSP